MAADLSGEITAVATAVLAVFAIATAVLAYLALRKQSRAIRAIQKQVADQQEVTRQHGELLKLQSGQLDLQRQQFDHQAAERRRAQASCIFIWTETSHGAGDTRERYAFSLAVIETIMWHIKNTSERPVFDLAVTWYQGADPVGETDRFPIFMPGQQTHYQHTASYRTQPPDRFVAVLRFRDAAGVHWRLRQGGYLDEEPVTA
jgi:hypothetical protein